MVPFCTAFLARSFDLCLKLSFKCRMSLNLYSRLHIYSLGLKVVTQMRNLG